MDAGFRTLSPTPLVPRGERSRGRMSPGSEMLTLEQFLKEANKEAEVSTSPKENVSCLYPLMPPVGPVHAGIKSFSAENSGLQGSPFLNTK